MTPDELKLLHTYLDGSISDEQMQSLQVLLRDSLEARKTLRSLCTVESKLQELAAGNPETAQLLAGKVRHIIRPRLGWRAWMLAALVLVGISVGIYFTFAAQQPEVVGHFGTLNGCRWVDSKTQVTTGDPVRSGQHVDLSAGQAEVIFANGAVSTLIGPCIFDVESGNCIFLTVGQIKTLAATPAAKGFTVRTRTARVVDLGTEFVTSAGADGQSRVDVTSGEVDVHLEGVQAPERLRKGDTLSVEPGRSQVIVRIESGDETPAFHFRTIEPPSNSDAADHSQGKAHIQVVSGKLQGGVGPSAAPEVLLDGHAQTHADAPEESCFFENGGGGKLMLDLGRSISIARINCYSWHQNGTYADQRVRAAQKFSLYGYDGDQPPASEGSLQTAGWTLIARVNSDTFFRVASELDRPAQQASSISGAGGAVGHYRYLLWDVQATRWRGFNLNNTFYGEFDVHEKK